VKGVNLQWVRHRLAVAASADFAAAASIKSLIRHWVCSRLVMYFLAAQTQRLRGENPRITLEQVADAANAPASKVWNRWPHSWAELIERCAYYQERNEASYDSRRRTTMKGDTS